MVYLLVSEEVISVALVQEVEKEKQSIYVIIRVLHGVEVNIKWLIRCPWHSLLSPIIKILAKPNLARWMIGWAIELSEFQI